MEGIALVLLGAALSLSATFVVESWRARRTARAAARLVYTELSFHRVRLDLIMNVDATLESAYEMRFPPAIWSEQRSNLLKTAPERLSGPIAYWYTILSIYGNVMTKQSGAAPAIPRGPLKEALDAALIAAGTIGYGSGTGPKLDPRLFS